MSALELGPVERLLAGRVGLRVDSVLRGRLRRCVEEAAAHRGESVAEFGRKVAHDRHALEDLLDRVTVQETAFFRDEGQFEALADVLLPALPQPLTLWSAGCANGQEPYSLAMLLEERGMPGTIVATDVSPAAVRRTAAGRYTERELRGLSEQRRSRHLMRTRDGWVVRPQLRERVQARVHNLVSDPPPLTAGSTPVVFCRNVLIYLQRADVHRVIDTVSEVLTDDGWLFLGYSESLWHVTDRFRLERLSGCFVYRPAAAVLGARGTPDPDAPPGGEATLEDRPGRVRSLLHAGEAAATRGDHLAAATAFEEAVLLDADQPLAHLHLGLALEAAGRPERAVHAYRACRETLRRGAGAAVDAALEGFSLESLLELVEARIAVAERLQDPQKHRRSGGAAG